MWAHLGSSGINRVFHRYVLGTMASRYPTRVRAPVDHFGAADHADIKYAFSYALRENTMPRYLPMPAAPPPAPVIAPVAPPPPPAPIPVIDLVSDDEDDNRPPSPEFAPQLKRRAVVIIGDEEDYIDPPNYVRGQWIKRIKKNPNIVQ